MRNVEAAHVKMGAHTGLSQKGDDWLTVPLCAGPFSNIDGEVGCHNVQHGMSEPAFWELYANKHKQTVWQLIDELIAGSPKRLDILAIRKERGNG
jgi:hypothetical protein